MAKTDARSRRKRLKAKKSDCRYSGGATDAVKAVAKDAAKEIIAAFGGKADAKAVTAAVTARMGVTT
jgi:F-type H+-transporting ATPase subunit b